MAFWAQKLTFFLKFFLFFLSRLLSVEMSRITAEGSLPVIGLTERIVEFDRREVVGEDIFAVV